MIRIGVALAILANSSVARAYTAESSSEGVKNLFAYQLELAPLGPKADETLWVKIQSAVQKTREARSIAKGIDDKALAKEARKRVQHLERTYRRILWPATQTLADAMSSSGKLAVRTALLYTKRKAQADLLQYEESAEVLKSNPRMNISPDYDPIAVLDSRREGIFKGAVKAKGMLKKAHKRLAGDPPSAALGTPSWSIGLAEQAMADAAKIALEIAEKLEQVSAKEFSLAVLETEKYLGELEKGVLDGTHKSAAARAINAMTQELVTLEYRVSNDTRVSRLFYDLITTKHAVL